MSSIKNPRIVILIGHFGRGGCERQAFLLAREMMHRDLKVDVWALVRDGHDDEYAQEFQAIGLRTHVLDFKFPRCPFWPVRMGCWVQRVRNVAEQINRAGVDILLPFTTWPNVVAGLAYRRAGVTLCIWGERHAGGERIPRIEGTAAKRFRRFVANSTAGAEFLAKEMGIPADRISMVPNGVEMPGVSIS